MEPYNAFLEKQHLLLAGEDFCVDELWRDDAVFQSSFPFPLPWPDHTADTGQSTADATRVLHADTISCLPHRLIRIKKIMLDSSKELHYYFKLGQHPEVPNGIKLDEAARLYDYCYAMDPDPSNRPKVNSDSLVRKVFKPDARFPHLLVSKYPQTFKRGDNFSLSLDHCIRWYILSPFDRDLTNSLNQLISDKELLLPSAKIRKDIMQYMDKSTHMQKCIKYVYEQKIAKTLVTDQSISENLERIIRNEYAEFLYTCCTTLIRNKTVLKESLRDRD